MDTEGVPAAPETHQADVLVYGTTPGGIAAAISVARRGKRVLLVGPKGHVGGMAASGLCTTDAVRRHLFGGLLIDFIGHVASYYRARSEKFPRDWELCREGWFYEPSVAEKMFRYMLEKEPHVTLRQRGQLIGVEKQGKNIVAADFELAHGATLRAQASRWIDCTYEGDLAAMAGARFRVGRESEVEFGESLAGLRYMDWKTGKEIKTPMSGQASLGIQAYCARSMFTNDPQHRVPVAKPESYDEHLPDLLPLLEDFKTGRVTHSSRVFPRREMPGKRFEANGNIEALTSFNCPGVNWEYPTAEPAYRTYLDNFHRDHAASLVWFLQNDPHIPHEIAAPMKPFGLHDEEFTDNQLWPWQIYVRQARRIEGLAVLTQHSFTVQPDTGKTPQVDDSIGLGEHSFDIHPCHDRRWARGHVMEGVLWYPKKAKGPAQPGQVPYGAILPKDVDNLFVPVALSATHVAFSVLRMEPAWMTIAEAAGIASVLSLDGHVGLKALDVKHLQAELKKAGVPH